jgi:Protein of unknown function (DUF1203)
MAFKVSGLSPASFEHLVGQTDDALAALGAQRIIAHGRGFPDRIEMRDAEPGEAVLLVNYIHQPADTPFRASHAVYVLENATAPAVFEDALPPALARRLLSLRAFDADHMMIDAEVVEGAEATGEIERMLANAAVAYIHAHYARQGCYAGLIERT